MDHIGETIYTKNIMFFSKLELILNKLFREGIFYQL